MIRKETDNHVTTITLDRPEKLNAFSGTMREDLLAALRAAAGDPDCRVVVITGAGRAFCAGGDVEYMSGLQKEGNVDAFRKLLDAGRDIVTTIVASPPARDAIWRWLATTASRRRRRSSARPSSASASIPTGAGPGSCPDSSVRAARWSF